MASNLYVNKVMLANGRTLIDISGDTVTSSTMLAGYIAHDASGALIAGSIASKSSSDLSLSGLTVTAPAGYYATDGTKTITSITVTSGNELYVTNFGDLSIGSRGSANSIEVKATGETTGQSIISGGEWVTTTPTAYGTYYGKTVVNSSILQAAYPVGSLYATETSTDNPATILGFGTWTKYAPADLTWNDTDLDWNNTVGVTSGVYVWKRTA